MDLSVLIPSRNEMFLAKTIEDILSNIEGKTEIIVVCDGAWPDPPVPDNPKVTLIYNPIAVGQRAATNQAARLSRAEFIMKCDAHCKFDKGFDVKLMADCEYDWTIVPRMYNLHVFNWKCKKCGDERYQGPTPTSCPKCDNKTEFERVIYWRDKRNPTSDFFRFDRELHFQYWREFKSRPEAQPDLAPTMSLLGACWFMHRGRFWDLDGSDEEHSSWGQMGTEIACKSWLSGGQLLVNKKTWFAHLFRTQGGDFGFPYPNPGIKKARKRSHYLWMGNNWDKAIYPLSWIIDKFKPVPDWHDSSCADALRKVTEAGSVFLASKALANSANALPIRADATIIHGVPSATVGLPASEHVVGVGNDPDVRRIAASPIVANNVVEFESGGNGSDQPLVDESVNNVKGLVYYTDNRLHDRIMTAVQRNLESSCNGHRIVSVSLKPIGFGKNITLPLNRSYLTMAKQQLAGIEALDVDIVFMIEHDILYPSCHFDFVPPRKDVFYYNMNWWKVRVEDGQALHFRAKQVSGLCAYRDILLEYYRNRVRMIESGEIGGKRHFEPGTQRYKDAYVKLTTHASGEWFSEVPYVDIRHESVITRSVFDPSGYKTKVKDWQLSDEIPHWGKTKGRFWEFLKEAGTRGNTAIDGKTAV